MIKKINYLLILIASLGGLFLALTKQNSIIFILKDISIIVTISALYIIEKLFKIKINDAIKLIYIIFIFMAHFLGVTVDLYSKIYWYDKLVHFLSGVVTALGSVYLLEKNNYNKNLLFNVLFIISFSMLVASIWEVFEYLSSYYFHVDPQKVILTGVSDTMGDIIVALLGSTLISTCYHFEHTSSYKLLITKYEKLI